MIPVQALEATTLVFVGHSWGQWRADVGAGLRKPQASRQDLLSKIVILILSCPVLTN